MKELIKEIQSGVKLYRDPDNGIAWIEDGRVGLGISIHPNIDETGSVDGMIARGWWRKGERTVKSHGWIYNIDRLAYDPEDKMERIVHDACMCETCRKRREQQEKPYQALLYYAWQEGEEGIYHSFSLEDSDDDHDSEKVVKNLAGLLDADTEDDNFDWDSMYVTLPKALVERIKQDGVKEYIERNGT